VLVDYVTGKSDVYAYVLTVDDLHFVSLGSCDDMRKEIRDLRAGMTDPNDLLGAAELTARARRLFELVLEPVLSAVPAGVGVDELLIVPTDALTQLPFEALVMEGEAERFADAVFVLDRMSVSYGPSTPVLVALAAEPPRQAEGRVLAFGDPLYPVERPDRSALAHHGLPRSENLTRLPATRDEVLALAEIVLRAEAGRHELDREVELRRLRDERSVSLTTEPIEVYLGEAATPALLQRDLKSYSILHFASHGYVDPDDPGRSGLVLAFGPDASGYLPLADVLALDLDADLTVLSACQTAEGRMLRGEGVQSLARAFLYAGSNAVVASLWQVADRETSVTIADFYHAYLIDGHPPSQALHEAKLALRHGRALTSSATTRGSMLPGSARMYDVGHPFYWAPFTYIGP
jgi:CHAT domain-containing protein